MYRGFVTNSQRVNFAYTFPKGHLQKLNVKIQPKKKRKIRRERKKVKGN